MHAARGTDMPVRPVAAICPHCGTLLVKTEPTENEAPHRCDGDFEWLERWGEGG
jgi:hypothetical protein